MNDQRAGGWSWTARYLDNEMNTSNAASRLRLISNTVSVSISSLRYRVDLSVVIMLLVSNERN